MVEFTIPLAPVLVMAGIGGFFGVLLIAVPISNLLSRYGIRHHNRMAREIRRLRRKHNDWEPSPDEPE